MSTEEMRLARSENNTRNNGYHFFSNRDLRSLRKVASIDEVWANRPNVSTATGGKEFVGHRPLRRHPRISILSVTQAVARLFLRGTVLPEDPQPSLCPSHHIFILFFLFFTVISPLGVR